ncbi:hypothetical protein WDW86_06745 [Bdellovibrionota bacterium FG-2]
MKNMPLGFALVVFSLSFTAFGGAKQSDPSIIKIHSQVPAIKSFTVTPSTLTKSGGIVTVSLVTNPLAKGVSIKSAQFACPVGAIPSVCSSPKLSSDGSNQWAATCQISIPSVLFTGESSCQGVVTDSNGNKGGETVHLKITP